jgi:hypothetical protein
MLAFFAKPGYRRPAMKNPSPILVSRFWYRWYSPAA